MNPAFETVDEAVVPEVLTDEALSKLETPEAMLQHLTVCQTRFATLKPVDPLTAKQTAALVDTCRAASKYAEGRRTAIIEPHKNVVDETNLIWQPIVKGFAGLAQAKGAEVAKFIDDERKAAQREQQRLIDEANAKQKALDDKAEEERKEAERLRLEADKAATIEEAEVLHQQADKLEKKAEKDELKASQVVTQVVAQQPKALDLGGSTFVARAPKKTWMLAGWSDKKKPLRVMDPAFDGLRKEFESLPEAIKFLLLHSDVNPVYLNKSFGVIAFPEPFASVDDYGGSSVRGK